jgi:coupling of ubiquitin conjugation to ER degradation protein 1
MSSSDQTINIPQLILILFLGGLAIRYFFFSSSSSASGNRNGSSANNLRAREADVERIQQMFPQVSRRNIMWDLQRNGGNVVATTERILSGRGLEVVSLALSLCYLRYWFRRSVGVIGDYFEWLEQMLICYICDE